MTTIELGKVKKRKLLRNNEYYNTQAIFDMLYSKAKTGYKFNNLMQYIANDENILLAYRNIKKNKGSKTSGTDNQTILDIGNKDTTKLLEYVKLKLNNYKPKSIKRVEIPKPNGKMRPLGIPTIEDRLIQQCIKQVLEPICESKFHPHSYGFRPNRSTHHAISRSMTLINKSKLHFVVDIDIKSFFDNIDHGKLLKQMWTLGIRDKQLICIISKMLKSEVIGIGIQDKGTPQGGILSPLLSNIVLNELDWWLSDQWETFKPRHDYTVKRDNRIDQSNKYKIMRKTNLKEMYIVRYADDLKVLCKDYKTAQKVFIALKDWLKNRLNLDISPEKSNITNLRKRYTDFLGLGFKLKATTKNNRYVCKSHVSDKAKINITNKLKQNVKDIQKSPTARNVGKINSTILGMHQYYKCATLVNLDFSEINFLVSKILYNRLKNKSKPNGIKSRHLKNSMEITI